MDKLKLREDEHFRIAQITDLHLGDQPYHYLDQASFALLRETVDLLDVDLFILTGDNLESGGMKNIEAVYKDLLSVFNHSQASVAVTYGNHDTESYLTRADMGQIEKENLDRLVSKSQRSIIQGRENYTIEIFDPSLEEVRHTLYLLDSGAASGTSISEWDWLLPEQVDWFRQTAMIYNRGDGVKTDMVFIHMPIPEYFKATVVTGQATSYLSYKGVDEGLNTGMFAAMYLDGQIHSMYCGHYHDANYLGYYQGIQLNYGLVSGYRASGAGRPGIRMIDIGPDGIESYLVPRQHFSYHSRRTP